MRLRLTVGDGVPIKEIAFRNCAPSRAILLVLGGAAPRGHEASKSLALVRRPKLGYGPEILRLGEFGRPEGRGR